MSFRSSILDRRYVFEYDVGLWTYGTIQVLKDRKTNELKICKTVQKNLVRSSADAMGKLHRLRNLQHDHICPITDVLEDLNKIYVVSDRCAGGDVAEWIVRVQEEGNWLQEHTVAEYIRETLIALVHLHGNRQCHRDLRPSSLALTSKLPDAKVKLCDCGLAEIFDPLDDVRRDLSPYGAPEVLAGRGYPGRPPPSTPSDLWSVGAIAHQLLVGYVPPRLEDDNTFLAALARAGTQALSGTHTEGDAWSDRSTMSRDFVKQLLRPNSTERPTAAVALQHPWMLACVPLDPTRWSPTSDGVMDLKNRLLCFMLSVLVMPDVLQHRDVIQLRSAFAAVDSDRDGFVSRATAQRLMKDKLPLVMPIDIATLFDAVDVMSTGAVHLCTFLAAYVMGHKFGPPEGTGKAQKSAFLVRNLVRAFFECYGDVQRMVASVSSVNLKLTSPVVREVEQAAGVRYDEIVSSFPEDRAFNAEVLTATVLESRGRGTPLAPDDFDTEREGEDGMWADTFGLEGLQDLVKGVFQTCALNGSKQRGYRSILSKLGGQ